jgi:hypothetical protein
MVVLLHAFRNFAVTEPLIMVKGAMMETRLMGMDATLIAPLPVVVTGYERDPSSAMMATTKLAMDVPRLV